LYVTSFDGTLWVFRKRHGTELTLETSVQVTNYGPGSVIADESGLFVSKGQAYLAVDQRHVYISTLNPGDSAVRLDKGDFAVRQTYAEPFARREVQVLERNSGARLAGLPWGRLYADGAVVTLLSPEGSESWARGIDVYDPHTLAYQEFLPILSGSTITSTNRLLIGMGAGGHIVVFELRQPRIVLTETNLLQLTNRTDYVYDVRSSWSDRHDDLVFLASESGNENTPALFVLRIAEC
jgi:hypothetical protein